MKLSQLSAYIPLQLLAKHKETKPCDSPLPTWLNLKNKGHQLTGDLSIQNSFLIGFSQRPSRNP
jgi:predicted FMN-binding regulatory protein PaiB